MPSRKRPRISLEYTLHNKVQLIRAGNDYFTLLLQIIARAEETIHFQTYILDDDETGRQVVDALLQAVKRNVEVYLIVDAYASHKLSKLFVKRLEEGGIHFRFFEPFFKSKHFYIGRRMHHKLVVADSRYCTVGGINIGNRYNDMPGQKAWLDFALYAEGDIAKQVCLLARKTWKGFALQKGVKLCEAAPFTVQPEDCSQVRLRQNDWVSSKNQISKTYKEILLTAQSHVVFLCSYFMPGNVMKSNILKALKRGVKITVIMAGRSDVAVSKNAERFMYDWLLRNKVEIYEYEENILHAKLAVCDGKWMTIGSYNINNISAYASVELNLDVKDTRVAQHTEEVLKQIMHDSCVAVTQEEYVKAKNIFKQFINWCSYEFVRLMLYLFTFYFRQRRDN